MLNIEEAAELAVRADVSTLETVLEVAVVDRTSDVNADVVPTLAVCAEDRGLVVATNVDGMA